MICSTYHCRFIRLRLSNRSWSSEDGCYESEESEDGRGMHSLRWLIEMMTEMIGKDGRFNCLLVE